jgi:hypothetical protein
VTKEELARAIAKGIIETGIEGDYGSVSCSTAGDYPSIGVSQWEGERANRLLESITGGAHYAYRSYYDLKYSGDLWELKELLMSDEGQQAQLDMLAEDCEDYVETLWEVPDLDDTRCTIYAGMWCPTSETVVRNFLMRRQERGYDLRDINVIYELFREQYAYAACCEEYAEGYANRATATYEYVMSLEV